MTSVSQQDVRQALSHVIDPELNRAITDLDMVRDITIEGDQVRVGVDLTVAGCPLQHQIKADVIDKVSAVPGVGGVEVDLGVMSAEQRQALTQKLQGAQRQIPFARPDSLTKVYAITSGKGGVGKSSITANLAAALSRRGLKVGVVDADIYGFSIPRMLGASDEATVIDQMIVPPEAHGVKVISIGMFVPDGQAVVWRGPMLHRALQQFLADVYWGDLDVLLLDLPPGTGDVAISIAQLLPHSDILVVTTPQVAAAEVAERAGSISSQTEQHVAGVIENMSYLPQEDGSRLELFGSGGGQMVADHLSTQLGYSVPLLTQIPIDIRLREGSDQGTPVAIAAPDSPAAQALDVVAEKLATSKRSLSGRNLGVKPL
ncbi:Mrp/NBP35 family ATP-binding protein [Nanchangia anserum]|uniref:Iron-sulfur cluster carrier protein n=1 Tax=Nanchangia anserum TaxID=2692125 RepID=A0A8I0KQL8_9ACTO|nr:Mrp/NBP35 family ATP-binding protein [Nanchangia anserum]MBD3690125.1 Mrp/NBP35 family ATP-binding protein [Nanchangia anserum]QOX82092.1 Mrp/NBP35 family ATP-binding protein [Nanchangia anserum]